MIPGKIVCMKCQKNMATVKLTRILKGEAKVINLCQSCAAEESPYQKKMAEAQLNLSQILAGILQSKKGKDAEEKVAPDTKLSCSTCGHSYKKYKKTFFLGCPDCYDNFGELILSDLRKFHGSTRHRGKVPLRLRHAVERRRDMDDLKRRMKQAIEREEFELAAKLRDEIRLLQEDESAE